MLEIDGIIDFDLIQTVIMIDDSLSFVDPDEPKELLKSLSRNSAMANRSRSANIGTDSKNGPKKFRIEVKGNDDLVFIFQAASHKALLMWFNALLKNWSSGKAM